MDFVHWLMLIVILMTVEGFVFYVSFENSNSGSALGYVSFAGTITSIILAVLAIIYGFVQSGSQDRKSEAISEQMGMIKEVVDSLKKSGNSLGSDVAKLEQLTIKIDDLKDSSINTNQLLQEMKGKHNLKAYESRELNQGNNPYDFFLIKALLYFIKKSQSEEMNNSAFLQSLFIEYNSSLGKFQDKPFGKIYSLAGGTSLWIFLIHYLNFNKVINIDNDNIVLLNSTSLEHEPHDKQKLDGIYDIKIVEFQRNNKENEFSD